MSNTNRMLLFAPQQKAATIDAALLDFNRLQNQMQDCDRLIFSVSKIPTYSNTRW